MWVYYPRAFQIHGAGTSSTMFCVALLLVVAWRIAHFALAPCLLPWLLWSCTQICLIFTRHTLLFITSSEFRHYLSIPRVHFSMNSVTVSVNVKLTERTKDQESTPKPREYIQIRIEMYMDHVRAFLVIPSDRLPCISVGIPPINWKEVLQNARQPPYDMMIRTSSLSETGLLEVITLGPTPCIPPSWNFVHYNALATNDLLASVCKTFSYSLTFYDVIYIRGRIFLPKGRLKTVTYLHSLSRKIRNHSPSKMYQILHDDLIRSSMHLQHTKSA